MCASLDVLNFCTTGSPICSLLDVSYVPCIRTDNTQFKGRAREHNSWCLMCVYVCVVIPSILNASLHLSVYRVWAHQPGSHRRKANTVVFSFWGKKRHIVCYIIAAVWRANVFLCSYCMCAGRSVFACLRVCVRATAQPVLYMYG